MVIEQIDSILLVYCDSLVDQRSLIYCDGT
jgi:hypothetical protein